MSTWLVGDLHACVEELIALLEKIGFDSSIDRIYFLGDLINRGPESFQTLKMVFDLVDSGVAHAVLGNHDLHLLETVLCGKSPVKKDTFHDILSHPLCHELIDFLRSLPLFIYEDSQKAILSHAGIPHIWSLEMAQRYNKEYQAMLQSSQASMILDVLYNDDIRVWDESLEGLSRYQMISDYFTRMRYIAKSGEVDIHRDKQRIRGEVSDDYQPWFTHYNNDCEYQFFFGHWSDLNGVTNHPRIHALDTGCVWGRELTAYCLESSELISVSSQVTTYFSPSSVKS